MSLSDVSNVILTGVLLLVLRILSNAIGGLFIGSGNDFTFRDINPVLVLSSPWLSTVLKVNESCPTKLLFGVYINIPVVESKFDICP